MRCNCATRLCLLCLAAVAKKLRNVIKQHLCGISTVAESLTVKYFDINLMPYVLETCAGMHITHEAFFSLIEKVGTVPVSE